MPRSVQTFLLALAVCCAPPAPAENKPADPVGDRVLVYFAKDGAPLGAAEGMIALVSIADLRSGPRHVKWLNAIELRQLGE